MNLLLFERYEEPLQNTKRTESLMNTILLTPCVRIGGGWELRFRAETSLNP